MMEDFRNPNLTKKRLAESLPALVKLTSAREAATFDRSAYNNIDLCDQCQPSDFQPFNSSAMGMATATFENNVGEPEKANRRIVHFVSIRMPNMPTGDGSKKLKSNFLFDGEDVLDTEIQASSDGYVTDCEQTYQVVFHSEPLRKGRSFQETAHLEHGSQHSEFKKFSDRRYNSLKTWSGKLERQISLLRGKPLESSPDQFDCQRAAVQEAIQADRYFEALEGPELEILRPHEDIVLPDDRQWPFLLRFPISSFAICLGVGCQAILWKFLATHASTKFLNISSTVDFVLWCISVALVAIVSSIYLLKAILFFEAVRREYYHPIRNNFFFAPWIALLLLAVGVPPSLANYLHPAIFYILMTPILCLELKIYGQWMLGGERRLSKVANPTNQLSVVGNFAGAYFGAMIGLKEGPLFFFAVGLSHYIVLFVTLYQRLPTNETLPKELHPVFFLFVAVPSIAAAAWAKIQGSFDYGARIAYFTSMFLYFSLVLRVNFFRGFKFSLTWWAYTVPMTSAAIATIVYSDEVTNVVTKALAVILSAISTLAVIAILVQTIVHAFLLRDLFPNDIAIAISNRKPKQRRRKNWLASIMEARKDETENYFKDVSSTDSKDPETVLKHPSIDVTK